MPKHQTTSDFARRAVAESKDLRRVLRDERDALSPSLRTGFDRLLNDLDLAGPFDPGPLEHARDLGQRLIRDIASAGGAPTEDRTEDGALVLRGGTDASRRLARIDRALGAFLGAATWVATALEAEAALERHRARLAKI
ncbi:hypothetical protein [Aquicoccus sp. SU-CL01552]|uniref:hypothetical protein n=1 Tax=Aquicoccus sp. SU-CL01552 TaxID=3127656 RepID=UPI0031037326